MPEGNALSTAENLMVKAERDELVIRAETQKGYQRDFVHLGDTLPDKWAGIHSLEGSAHLYDREQVRKHLLESLKNAGVLLIEGAESQWGDCDR